MAIGWAIVATGLVAASAEGCALEPLLDRQDPVLQLALEEGLSEVGLATEVAAGRLAVGLADLSRPEVVYYARVNDDQMLHAASLPKIAILLAVVELAERQQIPWDAECACRLRKMITISDNTWASWGWDLATAGGIAEVLRDSRNCFYVPHTAGRGVSQGELVGVDPGRVFKTLAQCVRARAGK